MSERIFKTRHAFETFMASQRPGVWHVLVMHDAQCTPTTCRCKPWFKVQKATEESVADGAAKQAEWVTKSRN